MGADFYSLSSLAGIKSRRLGIANMTLDEDRLPVGFPIPEWSEQVARYTRYWDFFTGEVLTGVKGFTAQKEPIYYFPLKVNIVFDYVIKHAAMLIGEELTEDHKPYISTTYTPRTFASGREPTEEAKMLATTLTNVVNTVWHESGGRTQQFEGAILSLFLGGTVYRIRWSPWLKNRTIPISVSVLPPDYFFPVFRDDDYYRLSECYVAYRIPSRSIANDMPMSAMNTATYSIYIEHWTEDRYSIYIDGQPMRRDGVIYENLHNPFGEVPYVYIPNIRVGTPYGMSVVDLLDGITFEYNSALKHQGDFIRRALNLKRYGTDIRQTPSKLSLGDNLSIISLGSTLPPYNKEPKVWTEQPPDLPQGLAEYPEKVFSQAQKTGSVPDTAYGDLGGSQRSFLAVSQSLFPMTSLARERRAYWNDGMDRIAYIISKMAQVKQSVIPYIDIDIPEISGTMCYCAKLEADCSA
ncbi:MAG: hypothetical protein HC892_00280 [Saprospiraceae bacterium]|nr:hypothetical protein [Saprospiraceae bacterium]